jgi:probable addiction module antidote protein
MKRKFRDYQEKLIQDLQDPEEAILYLNEALKDEDPRMFLLALKNVCEAQGVDISAFAEETHITRQNIYHMLSKKGNLRWHNFRSIIDAMGLQLKIEAKHK